MAGRDRAQAAGVAIVAAVLVVYLDGHAARDLAGVQLVRELVDVETGEIAWQTPNPNGWKMTHSSIVPVEFGGRRMYVWCASGGVVGVSADDGALLWELTDWQIRIANVPTPTMITSTPARRSRSSISWSRPISWRCAAAAWTRC